MAEGKIIKEYTTKDFDVPAFSITTGTIGQYVLHMDINVSLTGYTPQSVSIINVSHFGTYIPVITLTEITKVRVILYRASSINADFPAGDIQFRVVYQKS